MSNIVQISSYDISFKGLLSRICLVAEITTYLNLFLLLIGSTLNGFSIVYIKYILPFLNTKSQMLKYLKNRDYWRIN